MSPHRRFLACLLFSLTAAAANAAQPIVTDSRIKTFVYNANEVFSLTTEYGYQSNVEFAENETIETVSIGDRVSWQIIPASRRLFIRAMEENAHTNMTVITNRRAYQFDLRSSSAADTIGSEALVYVVRFYYPGESEGPMPVSYGSMPRPAPLAASYSAPYAYGSPMPASYGTAPAPMGYPAAIPYAMAPAMGYPAAPQQASLNPLPPSTAYAPTSMNYRYTYSGPTAFAPVKIYDDGKTTFFKFKGSVPQQFSVITASGEELNVPTRPAGPDMVAVDVIAPRFSLRESGQQVVVYNESNGA